MTTNYVETNCTITHNGRTFESGGMYIVPCSDGFYRGAVYVQPYVAGWEGHLARVTTWHGDLVAVLDTLTNYRGNFCKMRRISFTLKGVKFVGDYCPDWSELCRVRSTRKVA